MPKARERVERGRVPQLNDERDEVNHEFKVGVRDDLNDGEG
jgi:hypothetical protein